MQGKQRIAVIGSGAVGSYYGGRLAEAGHDVRFLLRRDYHAVNKKGLQITSPDGDFALECPRVFQNPTEIGPVDWVICALKATSIGDAHKLLLPCVAEHTRILVLMNGLGLEDSFSEWFGKEKVFGGLAFTCINRGKPGQVHHIAYGTITIGHHADNLSEVEKAVGLWAQCKVQVIGAPSLLRARWEKLCWNIPFSGLAVAAGGITTDRIIGNPDLHSAAGTLMIEVISAGNADLAHHHEQSRIDRGDIIDRMFGRTATMGAYKPSAMIDFLEGRTMEIEAIFGEPLRRAQSLKVSVPYLTLLTGLLTSLNRGRQ